MQIRILLLIIILILYSDFFSQEKVGHISYQSSQYVYVKFDNTSGIDINDTLFIKNNEILIPVLRSVYVSSRSCACTDLGSKTISTGDEIIARVKVNQPVNKSGEVNSSSKNTSDVTPINTIKNRTEPVKQNFSQRDKLKLSVQSYSTTSNVEGLQDRQQWRYLLSSEIHRIGEMPLSFFTYFTYRQRPGEPERNGISRSLNVYDLHLEYNFNKDFNIVLGRNINRYVSNISTIDGIQLNRNWGTTTTGIILGSRPDLNYSSGVNFKLFETGIYAARSDSILNGVTDNTLAVFEQTNSLKTDRRFIYFQHSNNNILSNFYSFISTEFDLYVKDKNKAKNAFNLMNLYLLSRYNINRNVSLSFSYDNRKNIIYYETFKNGLDSLIDRETRQGIRAGLDVRPVKQIYLTISAGYNFKRSDPKPSRNLLTGISFVNIPLINSNVSLNYTSFENSYLDGNIFSINLSKEFLEGNLNPSLGYRRAEYKMNFSNTLYQNFLSCDLSIRLINKVFLSLNYEFEYEEKTSYNRVLLDLSSRF